MVEELDIQVICARVTKVSEGSNFQIQLLINVFYDVTEPSEKEKLLDEDEKSALVTSQSDNGGDFPELRRTGKYFGGLVKDVKRRLIINFILLNISNLNK